MVLTARGAAERTMYHVPLTSYCTFTQASPLTETSPSVAPPPLLSGLLLKHQHPAQKPPPLGSPPCPPGSSRLFLGNVPHFKPCCVCLPVGEASSSRRG